MTTLKLGRRALMSAAVATMTLGAPAAFADGHQVVDSISLYHVRAALAAAGTALRVVQAKP